MFEGFIDEESTSLFDYGEPKVLSGKCFSVSGFISFLLVALVTGKSKLFQKLRPSQLKKVK